MTEQEILKKIKQSAESIAVPESLAPENILAKCRKSKPQNMDRKFRMSNRKAGAGLVAAAAILCFIFLIKMPWTRTWFLSDRPDDKTGKVTDQATTAGTAKEETAETAVKKPESETDMARKPVERQNAGNLYTLAESYTSVYDWLEELQTARYENGAMTGRSDTATAGTNDRIYNVMEDLAEESKQEASTAKERESYSKTNVQTQGIDESDIVKTDGSYLYLLRGSCVSILSAQTDELKQVGELEADTESGTGSICAMYVDGDTLILMVEENLTSLTQETEDTSAYYDIARLDTKVTTSVLTYDISNRKNPILAGKVTQDGSYVTSRKDGTILYLFTEQYLLERYQEDPDDAIPQINGRKISEDCIYMGELGERALLISSLSVKNPDTVQDAVMLLDGGSEIYMGEDSLYLYRTNYKNHKDITEIAKFSLTGGLLNGAAAASVRGIVRDTFAIHEKDNKLRVLTTDYSGSDSENCLFLLDENLEVTGKLTHIAVGETIYAARYLGNMAYFITYRNTDPLFAADLSDEKNPKLVGELEITGFSEYLHFWDEDKLLGLGYETDPKTGAQKGLKLVMFDMSDPADLKTLGSKVLEKTSYSPALYQYKAVLADPEENLIGFTTDYYNNGLTRKYELYRWNEDGFEKILSETLDDGYGNENYRGLYIGKKFYIAHPEIVRSYDREDYNLIQTLKLSEQ